MIELDARPHSRRIKILPVSADAFLKLLKDLNHTGPNDWISVHGLPEDAKVVGLSTDATHREIHLIRIAVESQAFEETPPGMAFPEMRIEFTQHRKG